MDINKAMQEGARAFQSKLDADGDGKIEISDLAPALKNLFANENGDTDFSAMFSQLNADGLKSKVQSWLGNDENESIDGEQVTNVLGKESIASFADQLGIKFDQAVEGLQEAMPKIVDQASAGAESLMDVAKDLLAGDTSSAAELLGLGSAGDQVADAAATASEQTFDAVGALQEQAADIADTTQEQVTDITGVASEALQNDEKQG